MILGEMRAWVLGEMGVQHRLLFFAYFELWSWELEEQVWTLSQSISGNRPMG